MLWDHLVEDIRSDQPPDPETKRFSSARMDKPLARLGSRCGLDGLNSKRFIEIAVNMEGELA